MSFVTIVIEFETGGWDRPSERPTAWGQLIHLVESRTNASPAFSLLREGVSVYTLTDAESAELLRLLGQITVRVPWQDRIGFDGCTYELILKGSMNEITFRWWVAEPQGWESVGAVADYVMGLAKHGG